MNATAIAPGRAPALFGLPRTRAGWWSLGLALGFVVLFVTWLAYVQATPKDRPTFFSDPVHAVLLLSSVASAISGLAVGVVAAVRGRERSLALLPGVLIGLIVLLWTLAELVGHS